MKRLRDDSPHVASLFKDDVRPTLALRSYLVRLAPHGQVVVIRGEPSLCAPNVPIPQAFSPRDTYQ
jgi:hypothetical protein